jgi:integrase/recombinase XerD
VTDKFIIIDPEIKKFSQFLKRKRMSSNTIENRCKIIRKFFQDWQTITIDEATALKQIEKMKERVYSAYTINNFLTAIDNFVEFKGGKRFNIPRIKKRSNKVKTYLSKEQVSRILSSTKNIREKALLSVLAYSGLITQEVCQLKVRDVLLDENEIIVVKGKNQRKVYISDECCSVLKEYLYEFNRKGEEYLFTTLRANKRYSEWALRRLVKKVTKIAKLGIIISPRDFRNSLAIHLIENRARTATIIEQLGHKDYARIVKYEKLVVGDGKIDYKRSVPNYLDL